MSALYIDHGISRRVKAHAKTIKARADRLKADEDEKAMAGVRTAERREARQLAREKRAKDQAKAKMRDEIRRLLIEKAQVATPVNSEVLLDIHGCYEKGKQYLGALGGQV